MKYQAIIPVTIIFATSSLISNAAIIATWNGNVDGDWNNSANWDGGTIPADTSTSGGFNRNPSDVIAISGSIMPTNVPELGGQNGADNFSTPAFEFNSGGAINITAGTFSIGGIVTQSGGNRTIFTIGDGLGATASVTLNLTLTGALNRHDAGQTHGYVVNSDGVFNFLSSNLIFSQSDSRSSQIILNGGTFSTTAVIDRVFSGADNTLNFVDLKAAGSSFTANYGSDYTNEAAVMAAMGADKFFRSSTAETLQFTDNGGTGFTVSIIPEPSTSALLGLAGFALILRRRK